MGSEVVDVATHVVAGSEDEGVNSEVCDCSAVIGATAAAEVVAIAVVVLLAFVGGGIIFVDVVVNVVCVDVCAASVVFCVVGREMRAISEEE